MRYVGWGGLPQAFDPDNATWKAEYKELRQLLPMEEYLSARRSTQDAHYTSAEVIEGIYQGLDRLGLNSGPVEILEPSAGIGHFLGLMPEQLRASEKRVLAVELDPITAAIGRYLYPNVIFLNKGFQDVPISGNEFDLAIGNPPFGNQKVFDADRPDLDYSVHNFFLAKSIDSLRDGGLAAFVVSRYFLDATGSQAREYIAGKANLLGAIRLPNTAFKENALTEVTTDILFFQKTRELEPDPVWLKTGLIKDDDGHEITVNQYFIDHPEQMAGRMVMAQKMFREAADLLPQEDFAGFTEEIGKRLDCLPRDIYQARTGLDLTPARKTDEPDRNRELCAGLKVNSFFVADGGQIALRRRNIVDSELGEVPQYELYEPKNQKAGERIAGLVQVRDCLHELMASEQVDGLNDPLLDMRRATLNRVYDDFVKKYGFINSLANKQAFRDDPEYHLLCSLEREYDPGLSAAAAEKSGKEAKAPSAGKADIFSKRVLGPRKIITKVDTAKEALIVSMNRYGSPELDFMSGLYGRSADHLTAELEGLIYRNPKTAEWELADHYLTGDVKGKLKAAQAAAQKNGEYRKNVEALLAVQPPDLEPVDISVHLGSTWVPPEVVADFCRHLFGPDSVRHIGYHPAMAEWATSYNEWEIDRTVNSSTWGTSRYYGHELVTAILNHTPIKVLDRDGEDAQGRPRYVVNEDETIAANQKAEEIKQAFQDWIWLDQERRENLARLYNEKFNTHIPRKYDGSHLELPGSALNITLRTHQKDAIWRGIQDGAAMIDHCVGAGKTYEIVGIIMESRRMGLMKKPMVVVPNHILGQWRDAFYSLYPQAKVLIATKDDFAKENREKLFSSIATGDWDAVVVPHSSFKKIGLPPAMLEEILTEQINDLTEGIENLKRENGEKIQIKRMEKMRERLEETMKRKAQTGRKDEAVTFDKLGVDNIFLDESQNFKNLAFVTKMRNIAGLGNVEGSDQAFDMYVKTRYIQKMNQGRGVFFATGTPISNSIAELYTVQRYLQYDLLKEKGLAYFDAWASTFGKTATGWELDATGVGYKINTRFSQFENIPELINMYRTVADVITPADLKEQNRGVSYTPEIKGGRPQNIVVKRSELQAQYMGVQTQSLDNDGRPVFDGEGNPVMEWTKGSIIHRMEHLPKGRDGAKIDNPLKITNDARKAGLDYRLIDPDAPDYEGSKVNVAAGNIHRLWRDWAADRGTQLVFCDLSTPKLGSKGKPATPVMSEDDSPENDESISMDELISQEAKFSVYDDLKQKLVDRGIPAEEIRFIHEAKTDAQKAKLFEAVNQGRVRVLIGSTAKMGAGTNVQQRLVGLHHLDCPWRPSDLAQREGRIIRQGNLLFERDPENFEIEIIRYATEQTYDARMWQTVENKAAGIEQFRKGDALSRSIEDVSSEAANAAEMKAAATGNELIFTQVKLASELKKLEGIYNSFVRGQHQLERRIADLEKAPESLDRAVAGYEREIELRNKNTTDEAYFAVGGKFYGKKNRKELLYEVARIMKKVNDKAPAALMVGVYRGFQVSVEPGPEKGSRQFTLDGSAGRYSPSTLCYNPGDDFNINGFLQRLDNYLDRFEAKIQETLETKERKAAELQMAYKSRGQSFLQMELLDALKSDNREVMAEIQKMRKDSSYESTWEPSSRWLSEPLAGKQNGPINEKMPISVEPGQKVLHIHVPSGGSYPIFNDRCM